MATISLILTINEDDLDTKGRGEDNMLDELSSIAHGVGGWSRGAVLSPSPGQGSVPQGLARSLGRGNADPCLCLDERR
jgi:hypothetical protein